MKASLGDSVLHVSQASPQQINQGSCWSSRIRGWFKPEAVVAVCAITLVVAALALSHDTPVDAPFHGGRLAGLADCLREGSGYPCRLYTTACAGYGYANPLFYCDLFLLPFALLNLLGVPIALCHALLLAVLFLASGASMRWMGRWAGFSPSICRCAAFAYMFAPTYLIAMFCYQQVGTMLAMVFVPCVVLPVFVLLTRETMPMRQSIVAVALIGLGMTGILLSHMISSVMTAVFIAILCLLRIRFLLRHRGRIWLLAGVTIVTTLVTAWFWLPMLEQLLAVNLVVEGPSPWRHLFWKQNPKLLGWFVDPITIYDIILPWVQGLFPAHAQQIRTLLGVFDGSFALWGWVVLPLAWVFWKVRGWRMIHAAPSEARMAFWVWAVLIVIVISPPILFVLRPLFGWAQFPSRFFPILTCAFALFLGWFLVTHCSRCQRFAVWAGFAVALLVVAINPLRATFPTLFPEGSRRYQHAHIYDVGAGEYLPTNSVIAAQRQGKRKPDFTSWPSEGNFPHGPLTMEINAGQASVTVPRLYYKGYTAMLDGVPCVVRESADGLVEIVTAGRCGTLCVWYAGTRIQRVATWISCMTVLILLLFVMGLWMNRFRRACL